MKVLFYIIFLSANLHAQVKAPNYDFKLNHLDEFMPGSSFESLQKKYPKLKHVLTFDGLNTYKIMLVSKHYKFPVFIQVHNKKVLDLFAKLPTYFLHNVFHQSLINKWGLQSTFKRVEEQAVYIWKKGDLTIVYNGACTITCFPVYLSVISKNNFKPLMKLFQEGFKPQKL